MNAVPARTHCYCGGELEQWPYASVGRPQSLDVENDGGVAKRKE